MRPGLYMNPAYAAALARPRPPVLVRSHADMAVARDLGHEPLSDLTVEQAVADIRAEQPFGAPALPIQRFTNEGWVVR